MGGCPAGEWGVFLAAARASPAAQRPYLPDAQEYPCERLRASHRPACHRHGQLIVWMPQRRSTSLTVAHAPMPSSSRWMQGAGKPRRKARMPAERRLTEEAGRTASERREPTQRRRRMAWPRGMAAERREMASWSGKAYRAYPWEMWRNYGGGAPPWPKARRRRDRSGSAWDGPEHASFHGAYADVRPNAGNGALRGRLRPRKWRS